MKETKTNENKKMELKDKLAGCIIMGLLCIAHWGLLFLIISLVEQSCLKAFQSLKTYGIILLVLNVFVVIISLRDKPSEKKKPISGDSNIDISTELMVLNLLDD